jgi:hypothetical protein
VPPPYAPSNAKYVITSIKVAASPNTFDCSAQSEAFTITATIQTNATTTGFVVDGSFGGSGPQGPIGDASGGFAQYPVAPQSTVTVARFTLVIYASDLSGSYWMQFSGSTSSGSVAYSNLAGISKTC